MVIEVTDHTDHAIDLLKSPIVSRQAEERAVAAQSAGADPKAPYALWIVYKPSGGERHRVVDSGGDALVPFEQVPVAPGATVYLKATLSPLRIGAGASVWLEARHGNDRVQSNQLTFNAQGPNGGPQPIPPAATRP